MFEQSSMAANLLVSGIGFILFSYGRKMRRMPHTAIGVIMLVYPYFITDAGLMLGVVPFLLGLLWGLTYLGM